MSNVIQALREIIEQTVGTSAIYDAMDSDDLANVVRAARDKLLQSGYKSNRSCKKSAEESTILRKQGNLQYVNGDYKAAILSYNKALAYAPINSYEMKMAYANTSKVMLAIKAYQPCQANINACEKLGYPENKIKALTKRMKETYQFIMQEMMNRQMLYSEPDLNKYVEFDVARNAEVPCASLDVSVQNKEGCMKVEAARDIKSGTIVAMERAFVSTQTEDNRYMSCYNCHRMCLCFMPCEGCCLALFCTEECKNKCMEDYHRIECQIIEYFGLIYDREEEKLMARAAIKMSLKLGWDKLCVVSREMGEKRMKNSTVNEAFDENDPVTMLSYDDKKYAIEGKIFNGSLICAIITHRLDLVPGYFPEGEETRKNAIDAMSRIMLHLYSTFTNRIEIICSSLDYINGTFKCGVQCNYGWFSFTSKLAHSCEPNLFVLGLNNRVALVTLQRIKKGDELTISYIPHFYDMKIMHRCASHSLFRQKRILSAIGQFCDCRVCTQEWDMTSQVEGKLTQEQNNSFQKMLNAEIIYSKFSSCALALDALTGQINTTQHKIAFRTLRSTLHLCQMRLIYNVTYAAKQV